MPFLTLLLVATLGFPRTTAPFESRSDASVLSGYWAGGSTLFPDNAPFVQARLETHGDQIRGDFSAAGWNAARRAISNATFDGQHVHLEFPSAAGTPFVVDATLYGNHLIGTVRRGATVGPLHLRRAARVQMPSLDSLVGSYEVDGKVHLITWGAFGNLRMVNIADAYGDQLVP